LITAELTVIIQLNYWLLLLPRIAFISLGVKFDFVIRLIVRDWSTKITF